jgi:transposase
MFDHAGIKADFERQAAADLAGVQGQRRVRWRWTRAGAQRSAPRLHGFSGGSSVRWTSKLPPYPGACGALGTQLEVVKHPEAKWGFVLLPRRWVVERIFAGTARCRRLTRGDEWLPQTVAGLHVLACACSMLHCLIP